MSERRRITDAQTMRAFAHPVRIALLEALRRDGELTATRAAELLDESPGNMSWHLQTLAKYGFVEEAPGAKGRSRPWRIVNDSTSFVATSEDPSVAAAGDALLLQILDRNANETREWLTTRHSFGSDWEHAAFFNNTLTYLTVEELANLSNEIAEIFDRHAERAEKRARPEGAMPVRLTAQGHPLPLTQAGN